MAAWTSWRSPTPTRRGLARIGVAGGWLVAGAAGAVLAAVLAVVVLIIGLLGAAAVAVAQLAPGARRPTRQQGGDILEARNVGGHSWVAFGWDGR